MAKQTFTTGQVLTAAQMTSLQQTAMLGGAASAKTASYTLVAADAGTAITMSNASATTITVNTALFAAGDTVQITNIGAGVCTITAGTATVNTSSSLALAQYASGTLYFTSTSAAIFVKGDGAAAAAGYTLISTTATTSTTAITISSIPQTYTNLQVMINGVTFATTAALRFKLYNNNNSVGSGVMAGTAFGSTTFVDPCGATSSTSAFFGSFTVTNYNQNAFGYFGGAKVGSQGSVFGGGDTGAGDLGFTSIVVTSVAGTANFSAGSVKLYGI